MKKLFLILLLSVLVFPQSKKSVLTDAQKDSIRALIAEQLNDSSFTSIPENVKEVGSDRQYTTIQSAINAATSGDIIKVYPGTYTEQLTVNKNTTFPIEIYGYIRQSLNFGNIVLTRF